MKVIFYNPAWCTNLGCQSIRHVSYGLYDIDSYDYTFFLIRTKLNKNTEAEIAQKNKNKLRTDWGWNWNLLLSSEARQHTIFYEKYWRQVLGVQYHDLEWIPSFRGRSVTSPIVWSSPSTILLQIFVGEHVFAVERSETAHYFLGKKKMGDKYWAFNITIWRGFLRSAVVPLLRLQYGRVRPPFSCKSFVGEHVFLPNESSAKD